MTKMNCPGFVRAVIRRQGKVLLIKETKNGWSRWNFPGGKIENGETPEFAVIREVGEEIGVRCLDPKLFFSDYFTFHEKTWRGWYFFCEISDLNFKLESTAESADFFSAAEIDRLEHGIPKSVLGAVNKSDLIL